MDENYNENICFLYTLHCPRVFIILHLMHNIYAKYFRVKYNDSREVLIMMFIINVLRVIINHAKVVNMYDSYYESYRS